MVTFAQGYIYGGPVPPKSFCKISIILGTILYILGRFHTQTELGPLRRHLTPPPIKPSSVYVPGFAHIPCEGTYKVENTEKY